MFVNIFKSFLFVKEEKRCWQNGGNYENKCRYWTDVYIGYLSRKIYKEKNVSNEKSKHRFLKLSFYTLINNACKNNVSFCSWKISEILEKAIEICKKKITFVFII